MQPRTDGGRSSARASAPPIHKGVTASSSTSSDLRPAIAYPLLLAFSRHSDPQSFTDGYFAGFDRSFADFTAFARGHSQRISTRTSKQSSLCDEKTIIADGKIRRQDSPGSVLNRESRSSRMGSEIDRMKQSGGSDCSRRVIPVDDGGPSHAEIDRFDHHRGRCRIADCVGRRVSANAQQKSGESDASPRVSAISERLRPFLAGQGDRGAAVTLVATPERIVHLDAVGKADLGAGKATMQPDATFWIASMTKPITGTAVLMLQDEGKLSVADPVEKYLPDFKSLRTAAGKPAAVTIRHLLTHTSGMSEISPDQARVPRTWPGSSRCTSPSPFSSSFGTKTGLIASRGSTGGESGRGCLLASLSTSSSSGGCLARSG